MSTTKESFKPKSNTPPIGFSIQFDFILDYVWIYKQYQLIDI